MKNSFTFDVMKDTEAILSEVTGVLLPFGIEKIILFGSYSTGKQDNESDIDLLVIKNIPVAETRDFRLKLKKALWMKFASLNYSFDILVDNEDRIRERIALGDLFYKDIYTNGRVIYA
jgi:predicted nucleotidyltransferase